VRGVRPRAPRICWRTRTSANHKNYYELLFVTKENYTQVRRYIINNPAKWEIEEYYLNEMPSVGKACLAPTGGKICTRILMNQSM
jgi:hypothetical protein